MSRFREALIATTPVCGAATKSRASSRSQIQIRLKPRRQIQKRKAFLRCATFARTRRRNKVLNARIDEEVGVDDGRFLPIKFGVWYPTQI